MDNRLVSIAIDGPSGAGKSTLSRAVAEKLGILYVDTGAIYRTVGLAALRAGVGSKDAEGVVALLPGLDIQFRHDENGKQCMYLQDENVSEEIRLPEVSIYASDVSAIPAVRSFLMEMQRKAARENSVIMDGRDIGTVVLPDAGLKIFLTAKPEERARRRLLELEAKGVETSFEDVLRDIQYRDKNDSSRATAPLRPAEDSVLLDTTEISFDASLQCILDLIRERFGL